MTGWRTSLAAGLAALLLFPIAASALTAEEQQRFADGLFSRGLHEMALTEYRRAIAAMIEPFKGLLLGVFFMSIATVIGPTPPGTGVIHDAMP